jgi:hypothetical protein
MPVLWLLEWAQIQAPPSVKTIRRLHPGIGAVGLYIKFEI